MSVDHVLQSIGLIEETPDYLVVNKPPGMVTQGANASSNLLATTKTRFALSQVYPVHRLDADTSGVVLLAKNQQANTILSQLFQQHKIQKFYLALTDRKPVKKQGAIIGDMEKSRDGNWRLTRTKRNPAITHFFSYGLGNGERLLILRPETGKTHQLRVAMKSLSAPIIGDRRYGGSTADRLYLHAWQLHFCWNSKEVNYLAPLDHGDRFRKAQFEQVLASIGSPGALKWPRRA